MVMEKIQSNLSKKDGSKLNNNDSKEESLEQNKENRLKQLLNWISKGVKKASEKGAFCGS